MRVPTIHLNGTAKQDLLDQLEAAYRKIGEAFDTLKQAAPNGRDYYPQGAGAICEAQDEHYARLKKLDEVRAELSEIAEAIYANS